MAITDEQLKTIEAWRSQRLRAACAWCGRQDGYQPFDLVKIATVSGPPSSVGLLLMICSVCGHTVPFSAGVVGLAPA
jgi:hypothetical protein